MAPKKGQKMSLNAFLDDGKLGSWADEMDAMLPTAPAPRSDDGLGRDYRGRDDFLSTRPDRAPLAPREDVPLPTQPPFTAFVGNLAFDLEEADLGAFFGTPEVVKEAKIIRDREEKPKGFGYVEFFTVDGLKDALTKNGVSFHSRSIRVNVADPPKERERGRGFGQSDDDKFAGPWRRDGPLPDLGRDSGNRRRYDGLPSENREAVSDTNADWRSNRPPPRFPIETDAPPVRRRGSGFSTPTHEGEASPADAEEKWTIGGKFRPSPSSDNQPGGRFGSVRGRGDMGPPPPVVDEGPWRRKPAAGSTSPSNSLPPTPQLARRKLELLPRSTSGSSQATPLSSPQSANFSSSKPNPFGAARPVDVSAREAAAMEKIEKEKERIAQHSMSRQSSRQPRGRPGSGRGEAGTRSPSTTPATVADESAAPGSPPSSNASPVPASAAAPSANVRPSFSFAKAAAAKKEVALPSGSEPSTQQSEAEKDTSADADKVAEKLAEVNV